MDPPNPVPPAPPAGIPKGLGTALVAVPPGPNMENSLTFAGTAPPGSASGCAPFWKMLRIENAIAMGVVNELS